jgi:acyl-CoA reductase-like NAD-dependent aldehyde dehydrogenase
MGAAAARSFELWVGGETASTGSWHEVHSPFDGGLVGRVAWGGAADITLAVDAAAAAMTQPLPAHQRATVLEAAADLVRERREPLARSICAEAGKPISAARVEADRAVSTFTAAAGAARNLSGEMVPMDAAPGGEGKLAFTVRVPAGVVGAITPFNFPLNLVAHKVAPAIAAGCAVVLKPSDRTPMTALLLAEVLRDAGLPAGWLNVVPGPAEELVGALIDDERVRVLTFTGSSTIGWQLRARAAHKKVLLELGNSTPVIVHSDADVALAAQRIAAGGFAFAGQACVSVQRVLVHESVHDALLAELVPRVRALRTGDPADDGTDVGPVIDGAAAARIRSWVGEAVAGGAQLLVGSADGEGTLVSPVLLDGVRPEHQVSCREVFGPVVAISQYSRLQDAIEAANGTPYGLQAGIFTAGLDTALAAVRGLDFGTVMVNESPSFRSDPMPYGGVKDSGNSKEGPAFAIREMTDERLVVISGSEVVS